MATRDLSYLISFDVTDTAALDAAATSMEKVADATNELDEGTHTVDVEVPENLSTDIDDVGTSIDDLGTSTDEYESKGSVLESTMGKVAAGALIVGEAIDIAGQFVDYATQLWEAYRAKQELTEEVTRAVTDAILEQSGALDIAAGELEDVIANAESADQILSASIWEGIEAEQGAEEISRIRTALLDVGLGFEDLGPTIVAFEDGAGAAISNVFAGNVDNIDLFNEALANATPVLGEFGLALPDVTFEEFAAAVGEAVQSSDDLGGAMLFLQQAGLGDIAAAFEDQIAALEQLDDAQENVDYGTLIDQTFEAAQASEELRGVLDEVRTDLGPDASEFEVWQGYIERLQEVQTAADDTGESLDEATEPRTGQVDVDIEQARERAAELSGELDAASEPRTATVTAEADTETATSDLDALPQSERIAVIDAQADTVQAATDLLNEADRPRTAYIIADALVGIAQGELDDLVNEERVALIDVATGTINLPSAAEIISRVTGGAGVIRIPIDTYVRHSARIDGISSVVR